MGRDGTLPVIIVAYMIEVQVEALVSVLRKLKRATGWTIEDIIGNHSRICLHTIQLIDNHKSSNKHQKETESAYPKVSEKGNYQVVGCWKHSYHCQ